MGSWMCGNRLQQRRQQIIAAVTANRNGSSRLQRRGRQQIVAAAVVATNRDEGAEQQIASARVATNRSSGDGGGCNKSRRRRKSNRSQRQRQRQRQWQQQWTRKRLRPFARRKEGSGGAKRRRTAGFGAGEDGYRRWVFSPRNVSSFSDRFVIVSYNILGVENASKHLDLYHHIAYDHLNWEQRKKRIVKELSHYCPSILCFQEVDKFEDLADLLREDGYTGIYKGRTGEANDGCAIFWKEEVFSLLHHEDIEFQKYGLRNNVAQLCLLKVPCNESNDSQMKDGNTNMSKSSSRTVLVGNIHVLFNPNRGDIKLGQVRILLERASILSKQHGDVPVVLCGDLNSILKSAIYKYITSAEIDILEYDRKKISGQIEFQVANNSYISHKVAFRMTKHITCQTKYNWSEEEIHFAAGTRGCTLLRNPLKLLSAYEGVPGNHNTRDRNGEPLATSYHSKFMGTVDYIWHTPPLFPVGVVDTLPVNVLQRLQGLPSEKWGSDHLALVCKFAFAD